MRKLSLFYHNWNFAPSAGEQSVGSEISFFGCSPSPHCTHSKPPLAGSPSPPPPDTSDEPPCLAYHHQIYQLHHPHQWWVIATARYCSCPHQHHKHHKHHHSICTLLLHWQGMPRHHHDHPQYQLSILITPNSSPPTDTPHKPDLTLPEYHIILIYCQASHPGCPSHQQPCI